MKDIRNMTIEHRASTNYYYQILVIIPVNHLLSSERLDPYISLLLYSSISSIYVFTIYLLTNIYP